MRYVDAAEKGIYCKQRSHWLPLLACVDCRRFPCSTLKADDLKTLKESLFITKVITGFSSRRAKMYVFKFSNGDLKEAPVDFNPDNPDFEQLKDVEEVLCISKILVKQMKLVVKSKEERDAIRKERSTAEPGEVTEAVESKPQRKRKK